MTDVLTEANNIISSELPTVTITKAEYEQLKFGARLLAALQAEGIYTWDGFDRSVDRMNLDQ